MKELLFETNNQEGTMLIGERLATLLPNGSTLIFYGDLGAGKTTFIRGIGRGLHIKEVIQSPTFNIMKLYLKGDRPLIHIDAYRLADIYTDIGLDEYIGYESGLTVIEWPMYIQNLLPREVIKVEINYLSENNRKIKISGEDKLIEALK